MKFETVFWAYEQARNIKERCIEKRSIGRQGIAVNNDCHALSWQKADRQLRKFRRWLLAHAAKPCRAKRLEWKISGHWYLRAHTKAGIYEILSGVGLSNSSVYWIPMPGESITIAKYQTIESVKAAAQRHFNNVWREMTDCGEQPSPAERGRAIALAIMQRAQELTKDD